MGMRLPNYPETQLDFNHLIATEADCRRYLMSIRWPDGFVCPHCKQIHAWEVRPYVYECADCGKQTALTAGTLFQDTRYPLQVWFQAIWYITGQKSGASALGVQRLLGL